ncbi:histidine--tRNA ligase [Aureimonas fodinaquatilis]|uniref:Histidine--tRNA ligase n=1 Tax=Aureimonas fodinaquatilis TaxID=2565783 RepID=A0A5B0DZB6_9HYPH|nr:histidine--tRNA ligase [Aureimonas fodinaquatilis]KAA0971883.1 histidine--tRNA ligase [Aureimonas fodinaquatilis]
MSAKQNKVKARQPRGFVDRNAADLRAQESMLRIIRQVYESYGFEPVETPFFEYTDALGKFLPDSDRPNEGVFSLQDDDEEWLSLRYDLTAPLARFVAQNFEDLPKPYRSYRAGYVFRNEKPGPGRFRQFMQFDADIVGAPSVSADAEMAMMMSDTMEALGIAKGQYVVRVNNRKVLDGILDAVGLEGEAARRLTVLRALDKFDRFGVDGVRLLLGKGRLDESGGKGDFTKGAELSEDAIDRILAIFAFADAGSLARIAGVEKSFGGHARVDEGLAELRSIRQYAAEAGYDDSRVLIDPSVVRGLEYYTGPVFEAELLFDVLNEKGQKVQFGSVGGGGRYDGLVARFMSQPVPATGFSIGVSRLMTALKNLGRLAVDETPGPVVVTVMDRDRMADYQRLAAELRKGLNAPGQPLVPVEVFQGNPKQFGKQLQYADRRGSPVVIIQGGDEKAAGEVQIKDLIEGKRLSSEIEDNATWRAARPAQVSVAESDMVARVREILAAQQADKDAENV